MIFFWIAAVFLFSLVQYFFCHPLKRDTFVIFFLCLYHFVFVYFFYNITYGDITDSYNYFMWGVEGGRNGYIGTGFVVKIVECLHFIGIDDYFVSILFFAGLSAFGVGSFYSICSKLIRRYCLNKICRFYLFFGLLTPGLHFWTVPIGKDSLMIFFYGLIFQSFSRKHNDFLIPFLLIFVFMVRPHIGFCLFSVFFWYKFFDYSHRFSFSKKIIYRSFLGVCFLAVTFVFFDFIMDYIQKYSAGGYDNILEFTSSRLDVYSDTGSGLNLSSFSFITRFLIFFLGGLPWDLNGMLQLFSLSEGFLYTFLLVSSFYYCIKYFKKIFFDTKNSIDVYLRYAFWFFVYSIMVAFVLSYGSGNLGLIARLRVMVFLPLLSSCTIFKIYADNLKRFNNVL